MLYKDELLNAIKASVEFEDNFIVSFSNFMNSEINAVDFDPKTKKEVIKIFQYLKDDSSKHKKILEEVEELIINNQKDEY
ncbi:hypothetical protein KKB10_03325 [Patescibacteria group bacterium]|nr:hypothetical protein [Patescibacteria group bacterium]MBU1075158.1 hypothetical protein [Patescibacteria group bacterium]MBU1951381.1 hypothetical protein [Patescibacteria group bacterium]